FVDRGIAKTAVKNWSNWNGSGKLFGLYAADTSGDQIRVTIFNAGVNKFFFALVPGHAFHFSGGRIRYTHSVVSSTKFTAYEITLGDDAVIRAIQDTEFDNSTQSPNTLRLADLAAAPANVPVTVVGAVLEADAVK
uniref:OB domain-containing protein n=1 Tax=Globisporangium ultimum (strain ATCC 200006 / CBS 805.95 / DAOM BR144) TaxID=431595 RepID=K3WZ23_GLOUD